MRWEMEAFQLYHRKQWKGTGKMQSEDQEKLKVFGLTHSLIANIV